MKKNKLKNLIDKSFNFIFKRNTLSFSVPYLRQWTGMKRRKLYLEHTAGFSPWIVISKEILNNTWFFVALILIASFLIRVWHLGSIKEEIFDEVYFVKFAQNYLTGVSFFDIHPPLGKLIIAIGEKIFHNSYLSWRIMESVFGVGVIWLGYLIGKNLKNKIVGLFTALILALDGMLLVYSRVGLMDIFMVFFILLGFYAILKFAEKSKWYFLMLAGISLALAASIKYIAGLLILVYLSVWIIKKISLRKNWPKIIIFILIIPAMIYLGFFLFNFPLNKEFIKKVLEWHVQSLNYNLSLKEGHPYGSKWWSWFLLIRPIWLYFKDIGGKFICIIGLGNPLAWWASIIVIPTLVFRMIKKDKTSAIILVSFLIFLIPWAFFKRVLFFYHAMPSFAFLAIGTAYLLENLLKDKVGKVTVVVFFAILVFLFIYFLPIWIGSPILSVDFYHRMWLKSWI
ncbi:MAG: hypothetical protein HW405_701 [Candidatus Berkelbacteria bacterium]|nr:hypothetical protein [Candidatus Berkelbacteria bacterium]